LTARETERHDDTQGRAVRQVRRGEEEDETQAGAPVAPRAHAACPSFRTAGRREAQEATGRAVGSRQSAAGREQPGRGRMTRRRDDAANPSQLEERYKVGDRT
jgi:hypothetical protein